MLRKLSLIAFVFTAPLFAQSTPAAPTWFTITTENPAVSVTLPAGTTYRFGRRCKQPAGRKLPCTTRDYHLPMSMSGMEGIPFPFSDPDYGTVKEFDVLETSAAQTITVVNSAATPSTIAMVIPSLTPSSMWSARPLALNHTLTFTSFLGRTGPGTRTP